MSIFTLLPPLVQGVAHPLSFVPQQPTICEIDGLFQEGGRIFAAVRVGRRSRMIRVDRLDLIDWARFCRVVELSFAVPVFHDSQQRPLRHQRQMAWQMVVAKAIRRGQSR